MPAKGVGAHGGAPKWRHGWIPANAAARAIVARRKARALASEDSSSVTGVLVVNQRSDGWHVIEDTLGKSLAKFPTQEAARADLKRRERLERRAHLERLRLARSGQEKVNIDLRSPDPASGTPSLFRGRRNIVDLPLPPFLGQVPRLNGPHTAEDDAVNANPGYYSTLDTPAMGYEGELARVSRYRHQVNCYNCVQAWELRRRGYAVQAQESPELWRAQGQSDGEIAAGWHTSEDNPSAFTHVKSPEVLPMIEDMPPGSRVFIVNTWREAGGHVFTAEKAQDGTVHFYDPQPGKEIDWNDYLSRSKTDMAVLRVDDLVPVDSVENTVEPSAQTTPGTWRPSKTTMSTPVTDLPGMKKWLDAQMKGLTEQGAALPATANNKWQRDVLTARLSVYQAAAASTPAVLEDKLTILKGMEQEAKGNLGEDATERDYNAYKIIRIKRVTAEEILKKAVPNATGILVTGVPHDPPGKKVIRRWGPSSKGLPANMNGDEKESLLRYIGFDHVEINSGLRDQEGDINEVVVSDPSLEATISDLDRMISRSTVQQKLTVFRGVAISSLPRLAPGVVFRDDGYASTTADRTVVDRFGSTVLEIQLQPGQKALDVGSLVPKAGGVINDEAEILLPRGQLFRITGRRKEGAKTVFTVTLLSTPPPMSGVVGHRIYPIRTGAG